MRRWMLFSAVVLSLFAFVTPASATGFSLFGAYWSPDETDETLGLGLRFSAHLGHHWIVDVGATAYGVVEGVVDGGRSDIDVVPLDAGLRYQWGDGRVQPYLGAGLTFAKLESQIGELDDQGAWYALLGLDFGDDRGARLFLEALYRSIDGEVKTIERSGDRVLRDLDLSGFGINFGVNWRW